MLTNRSNPVLASERPVPQAERLSVMLQLREVASPSSPDRHVRFEIPVLGVIRDVDPLQGHVSASGNWLKAEVDH